MRESKLLPTWCKIPGIILIAAGMTLTVLYIVTDLQLYMPVLAIISSFLETYFFHVMRTNVADELLMLCLICGTALYVFSREKDEREEYVLLRYQAIFRSLKWNTILLIFSVIFFYGNAFLYLLILNTVSTSGIYIIVFRNSIRIFRKKNLTGQGLFF